MKIKKIIFEDPGFRMLRNIEIDISERITVIAGHNGIGKSTVLGLIANGSEIKKKDGTTLNGTSFQAYFHELFILDKDRDFSIDRKTKQSFKLVYSDETKLDLVKSCNVSKHTEKIKYGEQESVYERLKIVPRGIQDGWDVGAAAKVNIPTLFLSMSRMLPIGDKQEDLNTKCLKNMAEEDVVYIRDNFEQIINHKIKSNSNVITKHEVKGTTKKSFLPEFEHSTKTISLGQDALSTIITAFASFNKLKRIQGSNYNGGILLIDEIDAGFHPIAQVKLVDFIKREAKRLSLQVIVTTHSLTIIQEVNKFSDETARGGNNYDSIIYIENTISPRLMRDVSYQRVKADMFNIILKEEEKSEIKIYFEDFEAKWFFEEIIKYRRINLETKHNHKFNLVAAKLGCDNLFQLHQQDDYFKSVIIVFDNDVLANKMKNEYLQHNNNIITLPAYVETDDANETSRTPESQIYQYLIKIIGDENHGIWNDCPRQYHQQIVQETIVNQLEQSLSDVTTTRKIRDRNKEWFNNNKTHFETLALIKHFIIDYETETNQFINDLEMAINDVISIKESK